MRKKAITPTEHELLRLELQQAQDALINAYHRFNHADAPELVEACIYEIKACSARYDYLYRCVRNEQPRLIPAMEEVGSWV